MAFLFAVKAPEGSAARARWLYAMYAAAAAATMTKGLIGIVLPALVIGLWIVLTWNWCLLLQVKLIQGLILFLVLTVPWHVAVGIKSPEFWHFYFIREHFERFTSTVHGRTQPWWFFAAVMVLGFFPWTVIVLQALWGNLRAIAARTANWRDELFLALWFWAIFLFFSASDSKLIPYVTPIVVPVAVFAGRYVAVALDTGAKSLRYALLTVAGIAGALAVAAVVVALGHARLFAGDTALDVAAAAPALPWLALGGIAAPLDGGRGRGGVRRVFRVPARGRHDDGGVAAALGQADRAGDQSNRVAGGRGDRFPRLSAGYAGLSRPAHLGLPMVGRARFRPPVGGYDRLDVRRSRGIVAPLAGGPDGLYDRAAAIRIGSQGSGRGQVHRTRAYAPLHVDR
jgi:4-amino-4-deoxy-L-arabinose transferase-like glycosyltransferase